MKKTIVLLSISLLSFASFGQKKDTAASKPIAKDTAAVKITENTALVSIKDLEAFSTFLSDKLIGKDYMLVLNYINALIEARAKEFMKPKSK